MTISDVEMKCGFYTFLIFGAGTSFFQLLVFIELEVLLMLASIHNARGQNGRLFLT